ncbi:MAG: hypothetical protein COV44_08100 [Deltaproteobacteria bacterium CG11_big_fil_rev_8_21_14_0_20_45_16]|nr:MAG: hypothetical protein COV44_08100 [Deltaproteobacteria bacterium CG11_big_fil_rev_8_21_14_0_20_45_16]
MKLSKHHMAILSGLVVIGAGLVFVSCGGSSGLATSSSLSADIAIGSPMVSTSGSSQIVERDFQATTISAAIEARRTVLQNLLDATDKEDCNFAVDLLRSENGDRVECYGPIVDINGGSHPDRWSC